MALYKFLQRYGTLTAVYGVARYTSGTHHSKVRHIDNTNRDMLLVERFLTISLGTVLTPVF